MSSTNAADSANREFVDAGILVYSFDPSAGRKAEVARSLLDELWRHRRGCLNLQVLEEFYVSLTRKLSRPLSPEDAARKVETFAEWNLHQPDKHDLLSALELHRQLQISLWNAMIVQSARRLRCRTLWTEDLDDGQSYAGVLVRSPFVDSVMEYASHPSFR